MADVVAVAVVAGEDRVGVDGVGVGVREVEVVEDQLCKPWPIISSYLHSKRADQALWTGARTANGLAPVVVCTVAACRGGWFIVAGRFPARLVQAADRPLLQPLCTPSRSMTLSACRWHSV